MKSLRSCVMCVVLASNPSRLPILFEAAEGEAGFGMRLKQMCEAADRVIGKGHNVSDSYLIAAWTVRMRRFRHCLPYRRLHHHLIRQGTRTKVSLLLESGEPREVHHFALLLGYGVSAVNPYLAFETLDDMIRQGLLRGMTHEKAVKNYHQSCNQGCR